MDGFLIAVRGALLGALLGGVVARWALASPRAAGLRALLARFGGAP